MANCGVNMKTASDALKIVTHEDAELAKKPPVRAGELESVSESPQNLMELLNDIDGIKREIHERMRRFEAVKQAKSLLVEDAVKAGVLNQKLAEIGKIMSAARSDALMDSKQEDEQLVLVRTQESVTGGESRQTAVNATVRVLSDNVTLPWPKLEETMDFENSVLVGFEAPTPRQVESVLTLQTVSEQAPLKFDYQSVNERLEETARRWEQTDQTVVETRQLLEELTAKLNQAVGIEEKAAADFHSAKELLTTVYESTSKRLEEAERFRSDADYAEAQAKQILEQANLELAEARLREEASVANLLSAQQELTTAYQFASVAAQRRLDAAEFFKRSARWAVFACAFSWVTMAWAIWFALRAIAPLWAPGLASALIVGLAITFGRLGTRED